jgi:hypothetical protein
MDMHMLDSDRLLVAAPVLVEGLDQIKLKPEQSSGLAAVDADEGFIPVLLAVVQELEAGECGDGDLNDAERDRHHDAPISPVARRRADRTNQREFISIVGGAAAWPPAAQVCTRRIEMVSPISMHIRSPTRRLGASVPRRRPAADDRGGQVL